MPFSKVPNLHFLVYGAGAIGSYIGGSLVLAKQDVVFIERPDVAAALRERGLRLKISEQVHHIPNPVVTGSMEEALTRGPYDVVLFAVKSFDTVATLINLSPYKVALPPFLCFQNGVENEATITSVLGPDKVIAGTVTSAVGRLGAGDVVLERKRGVGIALGHPLSPALAAIFNDAGLNAWTYSNAMAMKWSKMLTNLLANATSAILNMPPGDIFSHPGLFRIEIQQLREALRVMRGLKLPIVDLPGTPVRALAFGVRWLPAEISRPLLSRAVGSGRGAKMPSFHIDLYNRRGKSEVDYLNGAVVRSGERLGIPTPVNRSLNEILLSLTSKGLPLDTFANRPELLLKRIQGEN